MRLLHGRERLLQARRLDAASAAQLPRHPGRLQPREALLLLHIQGSIRLDACYSRGISHSVSASSYTVFCNHTIWRSNKILYLRLLAFVLN